MNIIILHLVHIFLISSLFIYVGIYKTNIPKWIYTLLLILGIILIPYQIYKAYIYLLNKKPYYWYNLIHIFLIGPLLIWIGIKKGKTPFYFFDFLLMFGFASLGYHTYSLIY
jgi:hypothetical protein